MHDYYRYGTTTHIFPPHLVLNSQLLNNDPQAIKQAFESDKPPKVLVIPTEGIKASAAIAILKEAGLWLL